MAAWRQVRTLSYARQRDLPPMRPASAETCSKTRRAGLSVGADQVKSKAGGTETSFSTSVRPRSSIRAVFRAIAMAPCAARSSRSFLKPCVISASFSAYSSTAAFRSVAQAEPDLPALLDVDQVLRDLLPYIPDAVTPIETGGTSPRRTHSQRHSKVSQPALRSCFQTGA